MRTRNAIERLAAVAPPEPLLDSSDEDRILQRILGSDPPTVRRRHRAIALVLVGAVLVAAVVVVALPRGHGAPSAVNTAGNHIALNGARIEMAGFQFRTPAGFKKASAACSPGISGPAGPAMGSFAVAASADGGCVEAQVMMSPDPTVTIPTPAGQPVDVGSYQGYYDAQGHDVQGDSRTVLYVQLPWGPKSGPAGPAYLVLFAQGLSEDQLIAVAQSGWPANP